LDFERFGITDVPSQLGKCHKLQYINLFDNYDLDLKQVDSILQKSPTGKGLMLYLTDWDSVPQSLKSRIIGIKWQNNLLPIETSDFWQQQQLIYLSINGRDNTIGRIWSHNSSLFHKVMQFTELKYLKIINDRIKEIPASISQLTNLLELDLSNNLLESLPPEIGLLNNLIVLDLSDNRLSKLPPEIGNLKNLIRLELINNEISKLPPDIGKLSNLKELYLGPKNLSEKVFFSDGSYNNIETLPKEIGNLSKLSILNLHGNKIISLPRETGKLTNLKEFDLQENEGLDMVSVFSAFADFPKDIIHAVNPYELGYDSDSSLLLKIPPKFESYPKLNAKLWREFGSNLSTTEQYMLMITCYNKAVEVESDSALNWQLLINTYQTLLDYGEENYRDTLTYCYQKAINHFEKEIKRKKQKPEYLWYNLGQIYYYKEEYEKAIDCFEKSYNLNPKYLENCVSLGEAYINNNDYVNAFKYWKLTVEKEVKVRYYWHQLGYCYEMINKVDSAIICYQKAIKLEPENARTTWINLGGIYIDKKEYDKAIYHYEKALAIDSISNDAASIFLNISLCYLYTKQYQKAEIAAQKALAINKEEKYAYLSLARAYLCQGKYAQAEELFLKMKNEQMNKTETGAQATLRQLQTMLDAGVIPPEYIEDTKKIMNLMKE